MVIRHKLLPFFHRKIHVVLILINLIKGHIPPSIMIQITCMNISTIGKTKTITKIFAKQSIACRSSNCLIILLFDTKQKRMMIIRNHKKMLLI